jgi:HEAT repeat protein
LWTLDGLNKLDTEMLLALLSDKDAAVRASAAHLCRALVLRQPDPTYIQELAPLAKDADKNVRMQVALTLGLVNTSLADETLEPILKEAAADAKLLEALVAGYAGREAEFLSARITLPAWSKAEPWRQKLLSASASLLWRQRQPLALLRFFHLLGGQSEAQAWQQLALLEGLTAPQPAIKGMGGKGAPNPPKVVTLPAPPEALEKLRKSTNAKLAAAANTVAKQLNWPGKDGKAVP